MSNGEIIIGEIAKNKSEKVQVSLQEFRGHDLVNARVWFTKDDEWRPSNKGLAVNVRLLPDLIRLLEAAQIEVSKRPQR